MSIPKWELTPEMNAARGQFVIPFDDGPFHASLDAKAAGMPQATRDVALSFRRNLDGALRVASIPFAMAHESVVRRRFEMLHAAERIRALKADDVEAARREAPGIASRRLDEEIASTEGMDRIAQAVLAELGDHLASAAFQTAARELIRQASILCWGAFEALAKDLHLATLGTGAPGVKAAIKALTGTDGPMFLRSQGLWMLYQARHLIVHRRALVDAEYLQETGQTLALGSELEVSPADFEDHMQHVRDAGCVLLK